MKMKHEKKKIEKQEEQSTTDNIIEPALNPNERVEPTREIMDMTRRLLELENRYKEEKEKLSVIFEQKERLEMELYERMKDVGINQFRTVEFGLIFTSNRLWGKITDMPVAEEWLKENGLFDEVLKLTPIKARVNEILKKKIENGEAMPPGFDYSLTRAICHRAS